MKYLLDSNIIIYYLNGEKKIDDFIEQYKAVSAYILDELSIVALEENFIQKISHFSPKRRAEKYMSKILSLVDKPIVLLIDEADRLFEYKSVSSDFFGMLRAWNDSKPSSNQDWKKFNMILSYSSDASLAIDNPNQSPFNTGLKVKLETF